MQLGTPAIRPSISNPYNMLLEVNAVEHLLHVAIDI